MSHLKERKEKVCLNCKADLYGLYCHVCGQANTEPKESAWHLVTHFFYDITHFDGKFFTSLKDLIARPGFLSREYVVGRRASYLNPVRMYVFTSAFFFIIFFSVFNVDRFIVDKNQHSKGDSVLSVNKARQEALKGVDTKEDSLLINRAFSSFPDTLRVSTDSSDKKPLFVSTSIDSDLSIYQSVEQYDSAQEKKLSAERDGWFSRIMKRKVIELRIKYKEKGRGLFKDFANEFMHQLPKMLFISLPIFALLLRLLYIRRNQFYYVDHGIFAIHLYIYYFILMLFWFALRELRLASGWGWISTLTGFLFLYSQYYFYRAMYIFYKQGWFKTFMKYFLLNVLSFFVFMLIFIFFIFFSVMEI